MTHLIYKQEDIDMVRKAFAEFDKLEHLQDRKKIANALAILKDQGKAVMVVGNWDFGFDPGVELKLNDLCVDTENGFELYAAITTEGQTP